MTRLPSLLIPAFAAAMLALNPAIANPMPGGTPAGPAAVIAGSLEISGAFTRATLPNAPVGGGYLTIVNTGSSDDCLLSATSTVAGEVQIHEMRMDGQMMRMAELPEGIPLPAGSTVTLAPGGLHLMLMSLTGPLVEGTTVPVTLIFEKAGPIEIGLSVGPVGAREAPHGNGG
jgi:copper(I)-binding protein